MTDVHETDIPQGILHGNAKRIVSFAGISQHSSGSGGASAYGLAALNCARLILQRHRDGMSGEDLLEEMAKQETFEDILSICVRWSNKAHLDIVDIHKTPIFSRTLDLAWSEYEQPGLQQFQALLSRLLQTDERAIALVITRPPEILSVLKIEIDATPIFVTFDSHSRPSHPDGAAFIFHSSQNDAATYLSELLKFDPALLVEPGLQWQAQLLAHYSAHMFTAKEIPTSLIDPEGALMEASLNMLVLEAELVELRTCVSTLESDNRNLAEENTRLEIRVEDLEEDVRRHTRRLASQQNTNTENILLTLNKPAIDTSSAVLSAGPTPFHAQPALSSVSESKPVLAPSDFEEDDAGFATRIQLEWQEHLEPIVKIASERQLQYEETPETVL